MKRKCVTRRPPESARETETTMADRPLPAPAVAEGGIRMKRVRKQRNEVGHLLRSSLPTPCPSPKR